MYLDLECIDLHAETGRPHRVAQRQTRCQGRATVDAWVGSLVGAAVFLGHAGHERPWTFADITGETLAQRGARDGRPLADRRPQADRLDVALERRRNLRRCHRLVHGFSYANGVSLPDPPTAI
jgi:hypothetical protein